MNAKTMKAKWVLSYLISAGTFSCLLTSCAALQPLVTQPTVDVTKAPFKASTDLSEAPFRASSELTDGTSQATGDLTRPTKEFTSSTSPSSWFTGDGTLKAEHKVMAFTVFNYDNLKENIAQGRGEYLISLATLANVPKEHRSDFFASVQQKYPTIYGADIQPIDSVNRLIQELPSTR